MQRPCRGARSGVGNNVHCSLALLVRCQEMLFIRHCWSMPTAQIFRSTRDAEAVPIRVKKLATSMIRQCCPYTVIALELLDYRSHVVRIRVCARFCVVNFAFGGVQHGCRYPFHWAGTPVAPLTSVSKRTAHSDQKKRPKREGHSGF